MKVIELLLEKSNVDTALKNKSEKTGISMRTLRAVYNRGLAAWRTGHRPGVSQHQWAMGRVNSFIVGGPARKADADLWKKRKLNESEKHHEWPEEAMLEGGFYMEKKEASANFRQLYNVYQLMNSVERPVAITGLASVDSSIKGWIFRKNDDMSRMESHNSLLNTNFQAYRRWVMDMMKKHGIQ